MRYRLRTLLILLFVAPALLAAPWMDAGPVIVFVAIHFAICIAAIGW